jgi:subtilisin family serine protease
MISCKRVLMGVSLIFLIMILVMPSFFAKPAMAKISPEVLKDVEDDKKIKVVIKLNNEKKSLKGLSSKAKELESIDNEDNVNRDVNKYKNYISKEVTLDELVELESSDEVVGVSKSHEIHAFLQETVSVINSTIVNSLKLSGLNLTGSLRSVCVIDSGVDFTHPDLVGKNKSCVIDCFNKICIEDCSVGDANGHGTHVAGIVGASEGIFGIANNVSLIGVKVLDASGDGSGNDLDLSRAIDYCVAQNVDVITMSLGTSALYNSDCGSLMSPWTESIDVAFANNISVIAASGNDGNSTHIASPACIGNVTPVGDTYDANVGGKTWIGTCSDVSTFVDKIVCHANRNSLVQLFAPGAMINSTWTGGGYSVQGGTSMAAPVVAGAFAIIHQVLNLTGRSMNGLDIEDVFNSTGTSINDVVSGLDFSRIDVYEAILSLDNLAPNVSLNSPSNGHVNLTQNHTFNCNYTDWKLSNVSFYLWNSSGLYYNESFNVDEISGNSFFNVSNLPNDNYKWNCLVSDNKSNSAFASSNFSLTIGGIVSDLVSPVNNSYSNKEINFSCNSSSEMSYDLSNVSFYLWNSSSLVYNESKAISGSNNFSYFNYSFSDEGSYSWNCLNYNNGSNSSWGESNYTFTYDSSLPNISLISPLDSVSYTSSSQSIDFSYNVSDNYNIANCSLIVNDVVSISNSSIDKSLNLSLTQSFVPGSYVWSINCSDDAGNIDNSSSRGFSVSAPSVGSSSSSSGGGGGGGVISKTYTLNSLQASSGYTNQLKKNEKIKFTFFDKGSDSHTLNVDNIGINFVELTIRSEPIKLKLGVGQSAKLNLTSPDFYDLYVKLNSVNGKADLTIQTIHEEIVGDSLITGDVIDESVSDDESLDEDIDALGSEIGKLRLIVSVLVLIIIGIVIFLLTRWKKIEIFEGKKFDKKKIVGRKRDGGKGRRGEKIKTGKKKK